MTTYQKEQGAGTATAVAPDESWSTSSARAEALAVRLEQGAAALADLARGLTGTQWKTRIPGDWRTVGVVVHHVASMYPIEIELAQVLASGKPVEGVRWNNVHEINAQHRDDHSGVTQEQALLLLEQNAAAAAAAIREFSDEQLDTAATLSLNADAPLTSQFMLEDHAVRHAYHHLAKIRETLGV